MVNKQVYMSAQMVLRLSKFAGEIERRTANLLLWSQHRQHIKRKSHNLRLIVQTYETIDIYAFLYTIKIKDCRLQIQIQYLNVKFLLRCNITLSTNIIKRLTFQNAFNERLNKFILMTVNHFNFLLPSTNAVQYFIFI